jgi:1-acyl-sn-glycerol-3-phosphate acyltransferase
VPIISDHKKSATDQFALYHESVFRHGNAQDLADKIDYWFEHPKERAEAGVAYARTQKRYAVSKSVHQMERVYRKLKDAGRNAYHKCLLNRVLQRAFSTLIVVPLFFLWTRLILGVRVKGSHNLYRVRGALTVCNHVHVFDSVLVGIAAFPRKPIYPTIDVNLDTLFPGVLVHSLGGVPIPKRLSDMQTFFDEMEYSLRRGRIVHFFPEGNLEPYNTELQDFKRGAFHLAAQARVPIIPITISFVEPHGIHKIYKLFRRKPLMQVQVDKPIYPVSLDAEKDEKARLKETRELMEEQIRETTTAGRAHGRKTGTSGPHKPDQETEDQPARAA